MEKVYLVVVDSATDFEKDFSVVAFKNYKDAKVHFDMEVEAAKIDRDIDWVEETTINEYTTYEEGYYIQNHIDVYLLERILGDE